METRQRIVHELLGQMVHVEVDRPIGYQHGDIVYPINYGYIPQCAPASQHNIPVIGTRRAEKWQGTHSS